MLRGSTPEQRKPSLRFQGNRLPVYIVILLTVDQQYQVKVLLLYANASQCSVIRTLPNLFAFKNDSRDTDPAYIADTDILSTGAYIFISA
jgi:hypothetical protein